MKTYQHIFFDLDRTLWDYERNADEALRLLIDKYNLHKRGVEDPAKFIHEYNLINNFLWMEYGHDRITKEELRSQRFHLAFLKFNINDYNTAQLVSEDFTVLACQNTHLIPGAEKVLNYLLPKYPIHLITNGFEETQKIKLQYSRIGHYFKSMISSERAQAKKPSREIFEFAFKDSGADPSSSLMIGDHYELDALAAMNAGMDAVYFAPAEKEGAEATYTISHLEELLRIL